MLPAAPSLTFIHEHQLQFPENGHRFAADYPRVPRNSSTPELHARSGWSFDGRTWKAIPSPFLDAKYASALWLESPRSHATQRTRILQYACFGVCFVGWQYAWNCMRHRGCPERFEHKRNHPTSSCIPSTWLRQLQHCMLWAMVCIICVRPFGLEPGRECPRNVDVHGSLCPTPMHPICVLLSPYLWDICWIRCC